MNYNNSTTFYRQQFQDTGKKKKSASYLRSLLLRGLFVTMIAVGVIGIRYTNENTYQNVFRFVRTQCNSNISFYEAYHTYKELDLTQILDDCKQYVTKHTFLNE